VTATLTPTEEGVGTGPMERGELRAAALTHKGAVRADNQDAYLCAPESGLFAVIDGMGGQKGGRRAAELTRDALLAEKEPVKGLARANDTVYRAARSDSELRGMGCVASAVQVDHGVAHIAHVGDTRVYLAGSAGCEQLTADHTLAASVQERLGLSHRGARDLDGRNQVTRDIGGKPRKGEGWIDRLAVPLEQGSLLLLCSDGLYNTLGADDLFARLRAAQREAIPPARLVDELVALALERGAADNVTAVVVRQDGELPRGADPASTARESVATRLRRALIPFLLGLALGLAAAERYFP
jgi:serine/threonine protein phosphatase PrpC